MVGVEASLGVDVSEGGGSSAPIIAPENWACDAKPSGGAVTTTLSTGNWRNLVVNSTIPHVEMTNPNLVYQGNGRYLNTYGAQITVKGFVSGNAYIHNISTTSMNFTVGIWDGCSGQ